MNSAPLGKPEQELKTISSPTMKNAHTRALTTRHL